MKNIFIMLLIVLFFSSCGNNLKSIKLQNLNIVVLFSDKNFKKYEEQYISENIDTSNLKFMSLNHNIVKSFEELTSNNDIDIIISFLGTQEMLKLDKSIENLKIPIIAAIATNPEIINNEYISRICIDDVFEGQLAASFLMDELFISHTSILIDSSNIFSTNLVNIFLDRYEMINGNINTIIDTKLLINNKKKFIKEIEEKEVKTIYAVANANKIKELMKVIKDERLNIKVISNDGLFSSFKTKYKEDLHLLNGVITIDNYPGETKAGDSYSSLIYDSLVLLKQAEDRCNTANKECILKYIRNSNIFVGSIDRIKIIDGKAIRNAYVNEIKNSKMHMIVKVH